MKSLHFVVSTFLDPNRIRSIESQVVSPRLGCGNGGLDWKDVKEAIAPIIGNRITIVDRLNN
jgi:hypothetical protein